MDPDAKTFNMIFTKAPSCIVPADSDVIRPRARPVPRLRDRARAGAAARHPRPGRGHGRQPARVRGRRRDRERLLGARRADPADAVLQGQVASARSAPSGLTCACSTRATSAVLKRLRLTLTVNGQVRQDDTTANLVYGPAETLTELSRVQDFDAGRPALDGDAGRLRALGAVAGEAADRARSSPRRRGGSSSSKIQAKRTQYLKPGDVVEARIRSDDGRIDLGVQRNRVVDGGCDLQRHDRAAPTKWTCSSSATAPWARRSPACSDVTASGRWSWTRSPDIFMAPRAIALDNEALRILQMVGPRGGRVREGPHPVRPDALPARRRVRPHQHRRQRSTAIRSSSRSTSRSSSARCARTPSASPPCRRERASRWFASSTTATACSVDAADERRRGVDRAGSLPRRRGRRELEGPRTPSARNSKARATPRTGSSSTPLGVPGDFDHVEFLCDPERPTPHMIAPGGRTRWEFMLQARRDARGDGERTRRSPSCSVRGRRAADVRIERKAVYRFHARACRRFSKRPRLPRRRRGARHAAVRRPGAGRGTARRREPRVEARVGRPRAGVGDDPRQLRPGAAPARGEDDPRSRSSWGSS